MRRGLRSVAPARALRQAAARTGQWVRAHWPILVLLVAGAALRVAVQLTYQPALIYIDSPRYLEMARTYEPSGMAPLGFPVLLLSWLLPLRDLALVPLVHHLLGLAMGAGIYALLRRWNVRRWLAALAAAPVLLDAYQLQIEQNILSDTLFEALVLAGILALLWRSPPPAWAYAAGGILLGLAATVRFVGMVLAVVALCAALLAWRSSWRRRLGTLALVTASFAVPLAAYSVWSFQHGKGLGFQGSMHGTLVYARTAPIADCRRLAAGGAPGHVVRVCPPVPVGRRPGPDFYAHDPRSPARAVPNPPEVSRQEVMSEFGARVALGQPLDVATVIATDVAKGFAPVRRTFPGDVPLERWHFPLGYPTYPPHDPARIIRSYGGHPPRVRPAPARLLRAYQSVGYTPGPALAVAVLAGLAGAAGLRLTGPFRRPRRTGGPDSGRPAGQAPEPPEPSEARDTGAARSAPGASDTGGTRAQEVRDGEDTREARDARDVARAAPIARDAQDARGGRRARGTGDAPGMRGALGRFGGRLSRGTGNAPARRASPAIRVACLLPAITGSGLLVLAAAFEFSWRYQLPGLTLFPLAGALGVTALLDRDRAAAAARTGGDAAGSGSGGSEPRDLAAVR